MQNHSTNTNKETPPEVPKISSIEKNEIDVKESYFDSESDYKRYIDIYKNHNSLKSYTIAYCMNDVKITIDFLIVLRNMILNLRC